MNYDGTFEDQEDKKDNEDEENNENYNFKIGEDSLDIGDSFKYLGIHFSYNGKFTVAINELCTMAERAMYSLYKKSRSLHLPVDI